MKLPPGPVCTLAWVEERAAEIRALQEDLNEIWKREHFSEKWREAGEDLCAKVAVLHANIIGAIAFTSCEPDAVSVCRAATRLYPTLKPTKPPPARTRRR